ncbi:MAG: phosphotransferase [Alphaproteobacteria bacterium]|nr:phosphotransferase [Alphaproteobacteria bacterium]
MSALARLSVEAAAAPEETLYTLAGHSGAYVVLHADRARSFVRKTAANPSQNTRLQSQIEKQRHLRRTGIPLPHVLMSGVDADGCAFFDMAYVPGRTLADAVANAMPFALDPVVAAVERMLWLFKCCSGEALDAELFRGKIEAIGKSSEAAGVCAERLLARDWRGIPSSLSHGDLTLENIMLGPEQRVVFIDCDAPWVSSWWLDLGKLYQDLHGHWCLRRMGSGVQRINAIEKLSQLDALFRPLVEPALMERLPQLAALHLFRALPYAADVETAAFICKRIGKLL